MSQQTVVLIAALATLAALLIALLMVGLLVFGIRLVRNLTTELDDYRNQQEALYLALGYDNLDMHNATQGRPLHPPDLDRAHELYHVMTTPSEKP